MTKRLTEKELTDIRVRVETARKLPFTNWTTSKLVEGDIPALLEEIRLLNSELVGRETSHIKLYNENVELKDKLYTICSDE